MGTTDSGGIGLSYRPARLHGLAESMPISSLQVLKYRLLLFNPCRCEGGEYTGPIISLESVRREDRGAYLCIAQNGVPPAVSRRVILQVKCKYTCINIYNNNCTVHCTVHSLTMGADIPHWLLPAVRDLTRDGRLSTYHESVLKLSKVSFPGEMCTRGTSL
jgi:hypothetical protein